MCFGLPVSGRAAVTLLLSDVLKVYEWHRAQIKHQRLHALLTTILFFLFFFASIALRLSR